MEPSKNTSGTLGILRDFQNDRRAVANLTLGIGAGEIKGSVEKQRFLEDSTCIMLSLPDQVGQVDVIGERGSLR